MVERLSDSLELQEAKTKITAGDVALIEARRKAK
jgi:IMP dehydrogenase/GMP reductase